jgi:acetyl esterase
MSNTNAAKAAEILDYATDERISRGTREFLKVLNSPAPPELEKLTPEEARKVLETAQASVEIDYSGIEEAEKTISADGFEIVLNIMRPKNPADEQLPVFVFIHGGGWVLGDYPTHKRMVRDLVLGTGFAGVFVNYTRTPEAVYPQQINEIYAALGWIAENGGEIGVDGKNLAIVGNSVGGNLAAVTCLTAKEKGGPAIKAQILMWLVADADFERGSWQEFGEARFLTAPLMKWMWDMYVPDAEARKSHHASPVQASLEQLEGLPPALIQVAENDILRDEGEAYGRKLDEAGVEVTTIRYDGMIHDFGLLNALAEEPGTKSLFLHAAAELKRRLGN